MNDTKMKHSFVVPENSIAGGVATKGEGVNVVDAHDHPDFNPESDEKSGTERRNIRILKALIIQFTQYCSDVWSHFCSYCAFDGLWGR